MFRALRFAPMAAWNVLGFLAMPQLFQVAIEISTSMARYVGHTDCLHIY